MVLGIYGCGGYGRGVLDMANAINVTARRWERIVFIDDAPRATRVNDADVYLYNDFKSRFSTNAAELVVAIGEPEGRRVLRERITGDGYSLATLVHPGASVSEYSTLGMGTVVFWGAYVDSNTVIEENVAVCHNCLVGHDNSIAADTFIAAGVCMAGNVKVGSGTFIGINAGVKERVTIGSNTIIGMASAVFRDTPDNSVALGNPARIMKNNDENKVFKW